MRYHKNHTALKTLYHYNSSLQTNLANGPFESMLLVNLFCRISPWCCSLGFLTCGCKTIEVYVWMVIQYPAFEFFLVPSWDTKFVTAKISEKIRPGHLTKSSLAPQNDINQIFPPTPPP